MDVGGSLSKLIYFERMDHPRDSKGSSLSSINVSRSRSNSVSNNNSSEEEKIAHIRARSNSLNDSDGNKMKQLFRQRNASMPLDKNEDGMINPLPSADDNSPSPVTSATKNALSKFYSFVNSKDAFGETGKKDENLTFYSR